jgi:hypothetical protein
MINTLHGLPLEKGVRLGAGQGAPACQELP